MQWIQAFTPHERVGVAHKLCETQRDGHKSTERGKQNITISAVLFCQVLSGLLGLEVGQFVHFEIRIVWSRGGNWKDFININAIVNFAYRSNSLSVLLSYLV